VARISSTLFMALAPPFSDPFMEDSVKTEHGRCHERRGQELRKIRRLAEARGGQSGNAVRGGQFG
jgi:hypothetical protein